MLQYFPLPVRFVATLFAVLLFQEPEAEAPEVAVQQLSIPPSGYASPGEIADRLQGWADQGRCELVEIARTKAGHAINAAVFGEREEPGRPAVLVLADPGGDRPGASQVALGLCQYLAEQDSAIENAATVYVVAVANPDAARRVFGGGEARRGVPVDEDRDGRLDEDPPDDLDGDGRILWMRLRDAAGPWGVDEEDARVMVERDRVAGRGGGWRLMREGRDDDGDGEWNEDPPGGYDLERNWPHGYVEHGPGAGLYPLSEPEARGLARFVLDRPAIALVIVLGKGDNLASPPKGLKSVDQKSRAPHQDDAALLKLLGERFHADEKQKPRGSGDAAGGFAAWAYHQGGALVLESAVWSPPLDSKAPGEKAGKEEGGAKQSKEEGKEKQKDSEARKLMRWNDRHLDGGGFIAWREFDHPELGTVEIGGWLPLLPHNPPAELLPEIQERWNGFLDSLAGDLPRIQWENVEILDLGGGVVEVKADLVNTGFLPTVTRMGEITRRLLPIRVTVELPAGGEILAGLAADSVPRLEGLGGHREFRWVLRLPHTAGPARLRAVSPSAGEAVSVVEVP